MLVPQKKAGSPLVAEKEAFLTFYTLCIALARLFTLLKERQLPPAFGHKEVPLVVPFHSFVTVTAASFAAYAVSWKRAFLLPPDASFEVFLSDEAHVSVRAASSRMIFMSASHRQYDYLLKQAKVIFKK